MIFEIEIGARWWGDQGVVGWSRSGGGLMDIVGNEGGDIWE